MKNWPELTPPLINTGGYIALPVDDIKIPEQITINNTVFFRKNEFHCSLVNIRGLMADPSNPADTELAQRVTDIVEDIRKTSEPKLVRYSDEFRIATRDGRQTIVIMTEVCNLEPIFEALNRELARDIPMPPTHVTLYCSVLNRGIGLSTPQQLTEDTVVLSGTDAQTLREVFRKD